MPFSQYYNALDPRSSESLKPKKSYVKVLSVLVLRYWRKTRW